VRSRAPFPGRRSFMRRSLGEAVRHWPSVALFMGLGIVGAIVGALIRTVYDDQYEFSIVGVLPTMAGWIVGVAIAVVVFRKLKHPAD
jgi:uncharacterized membrane protein YfcA